MKLLIVTNDNQVIDTIGDIEEYNLDKPIARASLIDDIQDIIKRQEVNQ
ncbi:hypothetical protein LCGC14_0422640 [marine sediment metagenome]|uniref:Uncharacterized protein n=1 Tax=marine sediment metagenome TaxID=412755 RepID=A0A0F9VCC3_9ZZZZ